MVLISLKSKFKALPLAPEKWSGRNQGTMGLFFKEFSKEKHYSWLLFSSPKDRIDVLKCHDSFLYILRILPKQESIKVGCVCARALIWVQLFATPWPIALQAPLSIVFSRQEYWNGLPFPPPGDLPSPWIKPTSPVFPALQVDSLPVEPLGKPKSGLQLSNTELMKKLD